MGCSSSKDEASSPHKESPISTSPQTTSNEPKTSEAQETNEEVTLQSINPEIPDDIDPDEKKRLTRLYSLRNELMDTEKNYVRNMTTAMKVIMLPILKESIIDSDVASDQFSDFIAIARYNNIMLGEFESKPLEMIATLKKYAAGLKIYKSYLQHFERRMNTRAQLVNNSDLQNFYKRVSSQHHSSLESFLIEPVQRIPRYLMLLSEIKKYSRPGDIEYDIIQETVDVISVLGVVNNEAIREMESLVDRHEKMMKVVELSRINVLDDPTRRLVKSSFDLKCTSKGSNMKPLQLWLFNDIVVFGRTAPKFDFLHGVCYKAVSLIECNVTSTDDNQDDFSFVFESQHDTFVIFARNMEEKEDWINAINNAPIRTAHCGFIKRGSRSGSLQGNAPLWKLDDASNICDLCSKQFSVVVRRHHCRLCGALVCQECSPHRITIDNPGHSHFFQHDESDFDSLSQLELAKLHVREINRVESLISDRNKKVEEKHRVCTLCYNHESYQHAKYHAETPHLLEISLLSATDLKNMDIITLSDPYVIFRHGKHSLKSRTIQDNLNPVWGTKKDIFYFSYQSRGKEDVIREICVDMYDEDNLKADDYLGGTVIDLNQYPQLDDLHGDEQATESVLVDMALQPAGSGRIQFQFKVILQPVEDAK